MKGQHLHITVPITPQDLLNFQTLQRLLAKNIFQDKYMVETLG